jgi:hypothetical protein
MLRALLFVALTTAISGPYLATLLSAGISQRIYFFRKAQDAWRK